MVKIDEIPLVRPETNRSLIGSSCPGGRFD
jgi:hypothetical protein